MENRGLDLIKNYRPNALTFPSDFDSYYSRLLFMREERKFVWNNMDNCENYLEKMCFCGERIQFDLFILITLRYYNYSYLSNSISILNNFFLSKSFVHKISFL